MSKNEQNSEGPIIGGSTLMGLGIGFIFLEQSALYFTAAVVIGVGFGLFASQIIGRK